MASDSITAPEVLPGEFPSGLKTASVMRDGLSSQEKTWIRPGTSEYRRAGWALFLAGFASFSMIYCVQPLLPDLARFFSVSPAESSLALSLTTALLAVSIFMASAFSQALGRRGLMFVSMATGAALNITAALMPTWHGLLVARALEGFMLGGVPAVAMAYLAEEIDPAHLGRAMGLYVGGTAFGGMSGRVGVGILTGYTSWQNALLLLGGLCLAATVGFMILLPRSRNFVPRPGFDLRYHARAWKEHLCNPGLLRLFSLAFLLTSIFVALFNYATFRLSIAPFNLGPTMISMIFLTYCFGIVSSSVAGGLGDRYGRRVLLVAGILMILAGIGATLADSLVAVVGGITLLTSGFFIGHSVASGSVGPLAGATKGHAASLYLLFYYAGSSIVGSAGGWFWQHGGWTAIVCLTGTLCMLALLLAILPVKKTRMPA